MQACSPLTARFSIWISLEGLRPIMMRSLSSGTSRITEPSRESINFAIVSSPLLI